MKRDCVDHFNWNYKLHEFLVHRSISQLWMLPIIMGSVQKIQRLNSLQVLLISRISWLNKSLSDLSLNDDGGVSRMVETEIILEFGKYVASHVFVRATAPVYYNFNGQLTRSLELSSSSFMKHFDSLIKQWGYVYCINLITRPERSSISDIYKSLLDVVPNCEYQEIDFGNFRNGDLQSLESYMLQCGFFCLESQQPLLLQRGVFRVNCFDGLEQTNQFLMRLSLLFIQFTFSKTGNQIQKYLGKQDIFELINDNDPFGQEYIQIWGRTLLELNLVYQIGFFKGYFGKNILINQHQLNTLIDGVVESPMDYYMDREFERYSEQSELKLHVISWNLAGQMEPPDDFIQFDLPPDIIVIGLQEIVNLNPQNVIVFNCNAVIESWSQAILKQVQRYGQYCEVQKENLVVNQQTANRISNIQSDIVKTGFKGTLGNKGATIIRFKVDDTQFSFTNCHLTSGSNQLKNRIQDFEIINEKSFPQSNKKPYRQADLNIFFGDLNIRLNGSYENITQIIQKSSQQNQQEIIQQLLAYDERTLCNQQSSIFSSYNEAPITFMPTYKYDTHSLQYAIKKKRVPSYCDRILFKTSTRCKVKNVQYNRLERMESDHRQDQSMQYLILSYLKQMINSLKPFNSNITGQIDKQMKCLIESSIELPELYQKVFFFKNHPFEQLKQINLTYTKEQLFKLLFIFQMVEKKVPNDSTNLQKQIRLAAACCCFCNWFGYYSFLNNFVRGCQICIDIFESINTGLWKLIFIMVMCCCCGFQCMTCVLCVFTCIDMCGEPCQVISVNDLFKKKQKKKAYQEADTWIEAFHALVYLKSCEMEGKIKETLKGIFVK